MIAPLLGENAVAQTRTEKGKRPLSVALLRPEPER